MGGRDIIDKMVSTLERMSIPIGDGYSYKMYQCRKSGKNFLLEEHCKAMVLSLLSANRPWKQIVNNMDKLDNVFHNYDISFLISAEPSSLVEDVKRVNCGNKAIVRQMQDLSYSVSLLCKIDDFLTGGIDSLAYADPIEVSRILSSGTFKIKGFAQTLALQYLRNIGVDTFKPDVHIRRILYRLHLIPYDDCEIILIDEVMQSLQKDTGLPITLINEIIWLYGATGYGEICSANPRCSLCNITDCTYNKNNKIKES